MRRCGSVFVATVASLVLAASSLGLHVACFSEPATSPDNDDDGAASTTSQPTTSSEAEPTAENSASTLDPAGTGLTESTGVPPSTSSTGDPMVACSSLTDWEDQSLADWVFGGDATWNVTDWGPGVHEGMWSAVSGVLEPGEATWLSVIVDVPPGAELRFWYFTPIGPDDELVVTANGAELVRLGAGQQYLHAVDLALPEDPELRWTFERDATGTDGFYDRVYIDAIELCW